MDLFAYKAEKKLKKDAPLADRMRPERLDEFVGQSEVIGQDASLRRLVESDQVPSIIFWGPPGTGKTTLARLIATLTESRFVQLSAVSSGVADLRQVVAEAQERLRMHGVRSIVFVDEIHRWNKAQQDAFLPHVENGTVVLIGATTENPSFEVNAALLSRCRVFVLGRLEREDIVRLLERAAADPVRGFPGMAVTVEDGVMGMIADAADGDARVALNALEMAVKATPGRVDAEKRRVVHLNGKTTAAIIKRSHFLYDKNGEEHYNVISALHKSMRGSDADASLYWLGRMLEAGEDPLYIARRLVRFASEDIGLADPNALTQATAAFQACHQLGMPECNVCLAQAVVYMARAPKSNALYAGYGKVQADIAALPNEPVPLHLRNAPTTLMKGLGYGKGYAYSPEDDDTGQEYLPAKLKGRKYL